MKPENQYISNKAAGLALDPYSAIAGAAADAIGSIGDTITKGLEVTEATKQQHDLFDLKERIQWSENVLKNKQTNTGFYIVISIIFVAMLAFLFLIVKNKK